MILGITNIGNFNTEDDIIEEHIPATYIDGELKIGHNGYSKETLYESFIGKEKDFKLLGMEEYVEYTRPNHYFGSDYYVGRKYRNTNKKICEIPYFAYIGDFDTKIFKLLRLERMDGFPLYSYLKPLHTETIFAICKDCGRRFVIGTDTIKYYKRHSLTFPTMRCRECIQKNKLKRVKAYKEKQKSTMGNP